jgi:hypothetical protein
MPRRAMRSGDSRSMGAPRKRIAPFCARVRPMIERMVVVLPMPLRPSSVTTSPASMARSMPKSTWLVP